MLQLKVGGVYRNRRGERIGINHKTSSLLFPYGDTRGGTYTNIGTWCTRGDHSFDLIAEWTETVNNHPNIPDELAFSAHLQARLAAAEARIRELEPKPAVKSVWYNVYGNQTASHTTYEKAKGVVGPDGITVRHDTITAPDGSVTYNVEVVK